MLYADQKSMGMCVGMDSRCMMSCFCMRKIKCFSRHTVGLNM